eukprot:3554991-Rhodomonas_salina.1
MAYFQQDGSFPPQRTRLTAAYSSFRSQGGAALSSSFGMRSSPGDFQLGKLSKSHSKSFRLTVPLMLIGESAG